MNLFKKWALITSVVFLFAVTIYGFAIKASAVTVGTDPLVELTADAPTQSLASTLTPIEFDTNIHNTGDVATGTGFNISWNISSSPSTTGATTLVTKYLISLPSGANNQTYVSSSTSSPAYKFSAAGTYYVQACADQSSPTDSGVIAEKDETNNCSPWKAVTVVTDPLVELTADAPTQKLASTTADIAFDTNVHNTGTISTGEGFNNSWKISNTASTTGLLTTLTTKFLIPLPSGVYNQTYVSSSTTSSAYRFTKAGTYYVQACADQNISGIGNVAEINEANNCSSWQAVTVTGTDLPELTSDAPTQGLASTLTPIEFDTNVHNTGTVATGSGFNISWNISSSASQAGISKTISTKYLLSLTSGANNQTYVSSSTSSPAYKFSAVGTYYVQACADQLSPADLGTITEIDETNNCSPWKAVTVVNTPLVNLMADAPTQTIATILTPIQFDTNVHNTGTISTGEGFNNSWEISKTASTTGILDTLTTKYLIPLPSGTYNQTYISSSTSSIAYTFKEAGTYYVRACADSTSIVSETDETDNCSVWKSLTVDPIPSSTLAGSLTATNCTIATDGTSCSTALTWKTINPGTLISTVTTPTNITVSTANIGTAKAYTVAYGSRDFYLYNNSILLATATATASCTTGTEWDGSKCTTTIITCSAPLTQTVKVACDVNANGDAATSGQVTRSQTKVAPSCTFPTPVDSTNSTYVSDNCVYPVKVTNYTITATTGANGTVTPAGVTTVNSGASKTYTITPSSGYAINSVLVDGTSVGSVTTYTFTNVVANHTISATFKTNSCSAPLTQTVKVACDVNANGDAATSGQVTRSQTKVAPSCTFPTPVDNTNSTYVSDNCVYPVKVNTYTITASTGANGTVTPAGVTTVNSGASKTYTITPATGYVVSVVTVDGTSKGAITTYTFTNVVANHTISATFKTTPVVTYTITASTGANGTVTPAGVTTVASGASKTYTITPATGYVVNVVTVDGASKGAVATYTFSNVTANHTISATFKTAPPVTYTITATTGANGTVTPAGVTTVNSGASKTYTITPATGYVVNVVKVDGASKGAVATYTFSNVTANHTISATFKTTPVVTYTITASTGANGTVTPAGVTTVNSGASQAYAITANSGYAVNKVTVDGISKGAITTYTFSNVVANHTISATFKTIVCSAPLTQTVKVACDVNANGDAATSGQVTRKQTKVAPSCTFGTPVDSTNSTYVSDNCVYPNNSCTAPLTKNVTVPCDLKNGQAATSGLVTRSQVKSAYPACAFPGTVDGTNSTYVSDSCIYPTGGGGGNTCGNGATDYPTCSTNPDGSCTYGGTPPNCLANKTDGYWTPWLPLPSNCTTSLHQTRQYIHATNGGVDNNWPIDLAGDGTSLTSRDFTYSQCPDTTLNVTYKGTTINQSDVVPYNSIVKVDWSDLKAKNCTCTYSDSLKTDVSCGTSTTGTTTSSALKRNTKYTIVCEGDYGIISTKSFDVLVGKLNTNYLEN